VRLPAALNVADRLPVRELPPRLRIVSVAPIRHHPAGDLLYDLGRNGRRHAAKVLPRVVLHDVGANQHAGHFLHQRHDLAHRQATRLPMGDAGRECGIECVEIDLEIHVAVDDGPRAQLPCPHIDHLHAKAVRLRALVRVHGADADLDQAGSEVLFHDPREGTCM
jgi:hypothetical protein